MSLTFLFDNIYILLPLNNEHLSMLEKFTLSDIEQDLDRHIASLLPLRYHFLLAQKQTMKLCVVMFEFPT